MKHKKMKTASYLIGFAIFLANCSEIVGQTNYISRSNFGFWSEPLAWTPLSSFPMSSLDNAWIGNNNVQRSSTISTEGDVTIGTLQLGSTVDSTGRLNLIGALEANEISVGAFTTPTAQLNGGSFETDILRVIGSRSTRNTTEEQPSFNFGQDDKATLLHADFSSSVNTVTTQNLSGTVFVQRDASLNLGADLILEGELTLAGDGTRSAFLDANGYKIDALDVFVGALPGQGMILNDGVINARRDLFVGHGQFTLDSDDVVGRTVGANFGGTLNLDSDTGAVNASAAGGGSLLNLGFDVILSGDLTVAGGNGMPATVDAKGHDIDAQTIVVGGISESGTILNAGQIKTDSLYVSRSELVLTNSDDIAESIIQLRFASTVTVEQAIGDLTGLTLDGMPGNRLRILDTSVLHLSFDENRVAGLDWGFRWLNSDGADHVESLESLISAGRITFDAPETVSVFDYGDGYTYVGYVSSVPEPSSATLLMFVAGLGLARRKRK